MTIHILRVSFLSAAVSQQASMFAVQTSDGSRIWLAHGSNTTLQLLRSRVMVLKLLGTTETICIFLLADIGLVYEAAVLKRYSTRT